jgi:F-type H+-transporting ATPase subunit alpha
MELLKQPQYAPLSVAQQVVLFYVGTAGHLDDIAVSQVGRFKGEFLSYVKNNHGAMLDAINGSGVFSDDQKKTVDEAVSSFKSTLFAAAK